MCFLYSGDEGHSTGNVGEADAAATEASKAVTSSEMVKETALGIDTEKTAPVPKKKLKRGDANKGIAISDNPSGPPMDDVSVFFACLLMPLLLLVLPSFVLTDFFFSADNSRIS